MCVMRDGDTDTAWGAAVSEPGPASGQGGGRNLSARGGNETIDTDVDVVTRMASHWEEWSS